MEEVMSFKLKSQPMFSPSRLSVRFTLLALVALSVLLLCSVAFAQTSVSNGSISGTVTDATGAVLAVDAGQRGPAADKKIYEARDVQEQFPQATQQAELGSLGTDGVERPQRKPRGGHLTAAPRAENRQRARVRVHVEHGIRRLKGFKLGRENSRHAMGLFPMVVSAVGGLVPLNRILQ